jgi:hypothetical protein
MIGNPDLASIIEYSVKSLCSVLSVPTNTPHSQAKLYFERDAELLKNENEVRVAKEMKGAEVGRN